MNIEKPLITIVGMGKGLSFAAARRFGREDFRVAMIGRDIENLRELERILKAESIPTKGFIGDAADEKSLRKTFDEIRIESGAATVLLYNAYGLTKNQPSELTLEDLRRDTAANLFSPFVAAQTVLPEMKKLGRGTLLFTGGGAGLDAYPSWSSLSIGKAALRSLVFNLHAELSAQNIHAATVTVAGTIGGGSPNLEPAAIAEHFWHLHQQKSGNFEREIIVRN